MLSALHTTDRPIHIIRVIGWVLLVGKFWYTRNPLSQGIRVILGVFVRLYSSTKQAGSIKWRLGILVGNNFQTVVRIRQINCTLGPSRKQKVKLYWDCVVLLVFVVTSLQRPLHHQSHDLKHALLWEHPPWRVTSTSVPKSASLDSLLTLGEVKSPQTFE